MMTEEQEEKQGEIAEQRDCSSRYRNKRQEKIPLSYCLFTVG